VIDPRPPATTLDEALAAQERAWNARPLLRRQYAVWYRGVVEELSNVPGPTVELGSGIGQFKRFKPDAITSDVVATRWADTVIDAEHLPHETASVANLVLFDVFHHLGDPAAFLDEAARVLVPTGRVVLVDPYCSPVSTRVFTRFHHERTDLTAPPFEADTGTGASPLESNQARATLIFYRGRRHFQSRWPHLPIVHERRFAFFVYPLTGGFTGPTLLPRPIYRPLQFAEGLLQPLAPLLAFRCMIVLQRR
jgi:SAM-dependent methyltransferase